VKTALNLSGVPVGGVRLPMVPLTEQETLTLQEALGPVVPLQAKQA
jgi:4-hydroxy-tetrahydrodipicolinate synthase